ncbi:MAG: UvrD-helicase domain-containing protein [Chloroflexi bacterium]|nr:UvrD-helicase domain-containing protein [Chloroflexota bacterium]
MPDLLTVATPSATLPTGPDASPMVLSGEQRAIVEHLSGGVLVLAPVGTGKTTVLTERVAWALEAGIAPERILCITFTNRAARELRARIGRRFPDLSDRLVPRTFHHLCADILRREAKAAGLPSEFAICDETESIALLRRILSLPAIDGNTDAAEPLYRRLQQAKVQLPAARLRWPLPPVWAAAAIEDERERKAAFRYERGLSQWQMLDFADLVLRVRALFAGLPGVRERWQHRFELIQVDEVQDTHLSEYEVVAALARGGGNLALFGDLDQTIYEWRGASPAALLGRFGAEFGPLETFLLTDNHRATRTLIHAADTFATTLERRVTRLSAAPTCDDGKPIVVHTAANVADEAAWIAEQVAALDGTGLDRAAIGVLAPANWYCDEIGYALERAGVPHVTAARTAVFRQLEVGDALAYLRLLLNPSSAGDALRVWERSTRGIGGTILNDIRQRGERLGLRLVDMLRPHTLACGDPLAALLDAYRDGVMVVFDLETTGLDEARAEIVEIAATRLVQGRVDDRFQVLVRPSGPVGDSERIHGLTDALLATEGQPPEEAIARFLAFAEGGLLVGHNVGYDLRVLAAVCARHGLPSPIASHRGGAPAAGHPDGRAASSFIGQAGDGAAGRGGCPDDRPPHDQPAGQGAGPTDARVGGQGDASDTASQGISAGAWGAVIADTWEVARRFVPEEPHSLAALAERLRLVHRPTHRAAADVATTLDLLGWLVVQAERTAAGRRDLVRDLGQPFQTLAAQLDDWRARVPFERPATLLARLLDEAGIWQRAKEAPAGRYALRELIAMFEAHDDARLEPPTALRALVQQAALAGQIDHVAANERRVPVLTIHQAKGLEFDTVFVAGCSDDDLPRRRAVASRDLEEERRLFYVALTRARRRLYLTRAVYSGSGRPRPPSRFLSVVAPSGQAAGVAADDTSTTLREHTAVPTTMTEPPR